MAKILEVLGEDRELNSPAVVKHVSETLKDESSNNSGPPTLFQNSSMEKIRHCCQNLNLFPYLLYSFDNSTSHPLARKVNVCVNRLLTSIADQLFFLYKTVRQAALREILAKKQQQSNSKTVTNVNPKLASKYQLFKKEKPKGLPFLLVTAIYLAPMLLALQLLIICGLVSLGKLEIGFIFLIAMLLFLGWIAMKVFFKETSVCPVVCRKRKVQ